MHVHSQWAILWILITYAVENSGRNASEIGSNKAARIVFPSASDENRLRQRRYNLTEHTAANRRSNTVDEVSSTNVIEDAVRQSQHPVKKQFKFKRLRYLSSDFNSSTKSPPKPTAASNTKEWKPVVVAPIAADDLFSNLTRSRNEPIPPESGVDNENSISGLENLRTPSHRKKRRRITTSITALNSASALPRLESPSVSRDNLSQYLNFGRKISISSTPRRNVMVVAASVTDSVDGGIGSGSGDANSSQDLHGRATTIKSVAAISPAAPPICVSNYRTIRPTIKNLKREIIQNNGSLCRWNAASNDKAMPPPPPLPLERTTNRRHNSRVQDSLRNNLPANETVWVESKSSQTSESPSAPPLEIVTDNVVEPFTTKILSTAVITSVSVKSTEKKRPPPTTSSLPPDLRLTSRKPKDVPLRKPPADSVSSAPTLIAYSVRPGLVPYSRYNASRNFNRNLEFSKVSYPDVASKIFYNVTLDTTEYPPNTPQPNIDYLMLNTSLDEPTLGQPESETIILELTTWKSTTSRLEEQNVSSKPPPSILIHDSRERDKEIESWKYRIRNNTSENASAGVNPTVFTIFSRNVQHNHSGFGEQSARPVPGFQDSEQLDEGTASGFHIVTYVLAGLGVIPLVIGIALAMRMILHQNKKQIFEGSEYSSEYNRNPLDFNAGVTSSPIATKLPRVHQQTHWEIERKTALSISVPVNSQWEFPRNKLRLQTILGQGNFGQVWKAEADDISGHEGLTRLVAVKMVKEISSSREKEDLIKELMIMQHLGSHPNVVTLLGCCTEKEPYMLIMEYVMYGKLLSFLRDHRTRTHYFNFSDNGDTLTSRDLTVFAYYVARGMEYLQNKQVIHRDLAARNILIDHNKQCKIADFGMSRYVDESGQMYEHRQSKGALPIRWMAPESLHYSCYTHKTDVWSFGILMWEIVTLGSMPYASMGARVVMRKVKEGYRLEKPKHCKSTLFNVISKCWHCDPNKRPSFTELKQDLLNLLEDPEHQGNYVDLDSLVEDMTQAVHGSHSEKFII